MAEILGKIWEVLRDADEKFGFRKILLYTTYVLVVIALLNWESILVRINDSLRRIEDERHAKNLAIREKISLEIHPCLVELRARTDADRVMLFEFHNSINNLIGIPFKYISMTDHAEPYGAIFTPKYNDVNSEVIGSFIRDLKVNMWEKMDDLEMLKKSDSSVLDVLNNKEAVAACYQYISVFGRPIAILVLEWHSRSNAPASASSWNSVRAKCSQSTQDLSNIIMKYHSDSLK